MVRQDQQKTVPALSAKISDLVSAANKHYYKAEAKKLTLAAKYNIHFFTCILSLSLCYNDTWKYRQTAPPKNKKLKAKYMLLHHYSRRSSSILYSRVSFREAPPDKLPPQEGQKIEKGKETSGADKLEQQLRDALFTKRDFEKALEKIPVRDVLNVLETTTDESVLRFVAPLHYPAACATIMSNPTVPPDLAKSIIKNWNYDTDGLIPIILNQDVLRMFSQDKDHKIREMAVTRTAPADVLAKLSNDPEPFIRRLVAGTLSTPLNIRQKLSKDKDADVRKEAFYKMMMDSSDIKLLKTVAQDPDVKVRSLFFVEAMPMPPFEILQILKNDKDESIRSTATEDLIAMAFESENPYILRSLAAEKNTDIRRGIARNDNTPKDIFIKLAKDPDRDVRSEIISVDGFVLERECVPTEAIKILAKDPDQEIAKDANDWLKSYRKN